VKKGQLSAGKKTICQKGKMVLFDNRKNIFLEICIPLYKDTKNHCEI